MSPSWKLDNTYCHNLFNSDYIYSKLINFAVPETIDARAINTGKKVSLFKKHENLTLAITSAKVFR